MPFSDSHPVHFGYMLECFESSLGESKAIYLSGPITTGPRYVNWEIKSAVAGAVDSEAQKTFGLEVVSANSRALELFSNKLRLAVRQPVINPAAIFVKEWGQEDYYRFWAAVIRQYVDKLIVLPGWNFSAGCAIEVKFALSLGIKVEGADGSGIGERESSQLVGAAISSLRESCRKAPALQNLIDGLSVSK